MVDEHEGLEQSLEKLISVSYKPVTARPEFKTQLLGKLKDSHRMHVSARRSEKRRNIIYMAVPALAAAVITLVLSPAFFSAASTPENHINITKAKPDAKTTEPIINEDTIPVSQPLVASTDNLPAFKDATTITSLDKLKYRDASGTWQYPEINSVIPLANGMEITPATSSTSSMIKIGNNAFAALDENAVLSFNNGAITLRKGCALIAAKEDGLHLSVNGKNVIIPKGAKLFCKIKSNKAFATNGSPAPVLVVMEGKAYLPTLTEKTQELITGNLYQVYSTPTGILPSRALGHIEQNSFNQFGTLASMNK